MNTIIIISMMMMLLLLTTTTTRSSSSSTTTTTTTTTSTSTSTSTSSVKAGVDGTDGRHPRFNSILRNSAREVGPYDNDVMHYIILSHII